MELASMLAGEGFTDHPRSVSSVIAALLRRYNDRLDDERRQDLLPYASLAVGTAGSIPMEAARMARLVAWGDELWDSRARRSILARIRRARARRHWRAGPEGAARYALAALGKATAHNHPVSLEIIDELIAVGSGSSGGFPARSVRAAGPPPEAGLEDAGAWPSLEDRSRASH
jgi:hypothetical protein